MIKSWGKFIFVTAILFIPCIALILVSHAGKHSSRWFRRLLKFKHKIAPIPKARG